MRKSLLLACLGLLLALPAATRAQIAFGPQASYGLDMEEIAIGARLQAGLPILLTGIQAIGTADYWFVDCGEDVDCSTIELNANLALPLLPIPAINTYFGGGINYVRSKVEDVSASDTGINVLAGIKLPGTTIRPFAEARFTFGGTEQLTITGGLLFGPR